MDKMKEMQALLKKIPRGKVTTYRELSHALGTHGYRYVGQLLNKNPEPDKFPCYKVVKADGSLGGFAMGSTEKIRRLKADGIVIKQGEIVDFPSKLYKFFIQH